MKFTSDCFFLGGVFLTIGAVIYYPLAENFDLELFLKIGGSSCLSAIGIYLTFESLLNGKAGIALAMN
jgi:hypothetical protein